MANFNIFISYSSKSRPVVEALAVDLEALGYNVWFDRHLSGGQDWWTEILDSIRRCHLFLFALTPEVQSSYPCQLEYDYATALNKRVLPVELTDINIARLPASLQRVQFVDYRLRDKQQVLALSKAITLLPPGKPLPKPLPTPPEIPIPPIAKIREQIDSASLTSEEQKAIVTKLKELMADPETLIDARMLFKRLYKHEDLLASVEKEIKSILNVKRAHRDSGKTKILVLDEKPRVFTGHAGPVFGVAYSADNSMVLTGGIDKTIRLWDISTGQEIRKLLGHTGSVWNIACSPRGDTLLSSSRDHTARLWDLDTGNQIQCLMGHTDSVWGVAYSPDGRTLLTGSFDKTIRLWDTASGRQLKCLKGHTAAVWGVAYSPDGQTVLSGSWDKTVRQWDVATGQEICQFSEHHSPVINVVYSPDGNSALTSEKDGQVYLWDIKSCQKIRQLGQMAGFGLAYAPDGQTAIVGSGDTKAQLWSIQTGKLLHQFEGHTETITNVDFAPDGCTVLTVSTDGTARLWNPGN